MADVLMTHFRVHPPLKRQRIVETAIVGPSGVSIEDFICYQRATDNEIQKLKRFVSQQDSRLAKLKNDNIMLKESLRPFHKSTKLFSELHRCTKAHKLHDLKKWLANNFQRLPQTWKVEEVKINIEGTTIDLAFEKIPEEVTCTHSDVVERVQKALKAKDDGNVADAAYHELKLVPGVNLPPINRIKEERKKQNAVIPIYALDKDLGIMGCYRTIRSIIEYVSQDPAYAECFNNEVVTLRFAGDGRQTTKKLGSTMATFNVPTEKDRSPDKEYCISLYDGKESKVNLQNCLTEIFKEMNSLREEGISVNGRLCKINWIMCSDWKYMAIILGINPPCSQYFCLWCHCSKKQIRDFSITDWPISRTQDECCKLAELNDKDNKYGVKSRPLVNIDFNNIVPDTLHLKLRIRGKLLNQVACWAIQQKKQREMECAMAKIGLKFAFTEIQDDNGKSVTKWSSFDCDDLDKVTKQIDLRSFLSNMTDKSRTSVDCLTKAQLVVICKKYGLAVTGTKDLLRIRLTQYLKDNNIKFQVSSIQNSVQKMLDVDELAVVWKAFEVLADALTSRPGQPTYLNESSFRAKALKWGQMFRKATFDEDVIPYIHVLIYHVPQFLGKYGNISDINCQTVEKKNHLQNRSFHRASQKSGKCSNYTVQIMERENRQLFARVNNIGRQKRAYNKKCQNL